MANQQIWQKCKRYSAKLPLDPKALLAGLLLAALPVCAQTRPNVPQFVEGFVKDMLAVSPVTATSQGYHKHHGVNLDELLDDYSPAGIQKQIAVAEHYLNGANALFSANVGQEDKADLNVIRLQCRYQLLDFQKIESYRHNPTVYVELLGTAIYTPFVLEYAPEHERLQQITARLEKIPQFVADAERNLKDAPPIWAKVAREENDGNIELIDHTVRAKIPSDLTARYDKAAAAATAALRGFNTFLNSELSKHPSDWRLGKSLYEQKFGLALATGASPERTLADAKAKLAAIRAEMRDEASKLYPRYFPGKPVPQDTNALVGGVLDKIAQQHTTPQAYFDQAKADLAEATRFVEQKQLLDLPKGGNLQVIPTPEFMRGVYGVGGFSPAPALEPRLGAFYWITPFTPDMSATRVDSKLREYNKWGLKLLTIHEAMPGHYVQAEYAAALVPEWRRALRAIWSNNPNVEGWAVYATELMVKSGFEQSPEMQLTWGKQQLRVVANTILDIGLHTLNMTDGQALDLMIKDTFQEREEAEKKLQRAKLSSCQLPTYFAGWRAWDQLEVAARSRMGDGFSYRQFHAKALNEGAVPMPVLQQLLAGE